MYARRIYNDYTTRLLFYRLYVCTVIECIELKRCDRWCNSFKYIIHLMRGTGIPSVLSSQSFNYYGFFKKISQYTYNIPDQKHSATQDPYEYSTRVNVSNSCKYHHNNCLKLFKNYPCIAHIHSYIYIDFRIYSFIHIYIHRYIHIYELALFLATEPQA